MKKKLFAGIALVVFLISIGSVFAGLVNPVGIMKGVEGTGAQLGAIMGMIIGISFMIGSLSWKKEGETKPTEMMPKSIWKYVVIILIVISVIGVFMPGDIDPLEGFTEAFTSGLIGWIFLGIMIKFVMGGLVGPGISGVGKGIEKRVEGKVKGKYGKGKIKDPDLRKARTLLKAARIARKEGINLQTWQAPQATQPASNAPQQIAQDYQDAATITKKPQAQGA